MVVAADAGAASVTTFVLESGEGTFASVTQGNLRTGGGDEAAVTLAAAAAVAFASDNLTLSLTLTATGDGGSDTATIRFISAPRARSKEDSFDKDLDYSAAILEAEILTVGDSELSIWHFADAGETYELAAGTDADAFELRDGKVLVADAQLSSKTYSFTLQLSGGEGDDEVIATREIRVIVGSPPPPPPVINAPAGAVVVAADAGAASVTTFVLASGEGAFAPVTQGNLQTGGGDEAAVTLERPATEAFASDNLTLSLTLTANGPGGSDMETIRFISAPRVIERADADRFDVTLRKVNTDEDAAVLPLSEAGIAIWHNGAAVETYTIAQANADFKIASDAVQVARALDVGVYAFTLRLTDGTLTASLPAQVSVGDPETAARARFVAQIEAGEVEWWTQINPYDRTPTVYDDPVFGSVTVDLFPDPPKGGDKGGTAGNPWPIYNVWHLQAIEGVSVSDKNGVSGNFNNFMRYGGANTRLEVHYYLAVDIDATTTRLWQGGGFRPISSSDSNKNFTGSIDGRGNAVRGLFISRSGDAGLIDTLGAGGTIKHLGVEEAEVRGNGSNAGILAALSDGTIERVWTTGKVVGVSNVGGLVGNASSGRTGDNWSTADVEATAGSGFAGGLFGRKIGGDADDSWAPRVM